MKSGKCIKCNSSNVFVKAHELNKFTLNKKMLPTKVIFAPIAATLRRISPTKMNWARLSRAPKNSAIGNR